MRNYERLAAFIAARDWELAKSLKPNIDTATVEVSDESSTSKLVFSVQVTSAFSKQVTLHKVYVWPDLLHRFVISVTGAHIWRPWLKIEFHQWLMQEAE